MDDVTKRTKEVKKPVNKGEKSDKGEKSGRPQHKDSRSTRSEKDHRTVKNRTEKDVRSEKDTRVQKDIRPERDTKVQKEKVEVEKAPEKEPREENQKKEKEPREENQKKEKVIVISDLESYLSMRDDGLVVIDFFTTWCGPCRDFAPVFEEIASNYPGVTFLSVDAESFEHEDTASVKNVPTFKIFLNGVMRREFSGINREKLERYIERYQIQVIVNGRTQRTFPREIKDKVLKYMNMLQPE